MIGKQKGPSIEYPPKPNEVKRFIVQSHIRGRSNHWDFRFALNDVAEGWTVNANVEGAIGIPIVTLAQLKALHEDQRAWKVDLETGKILPRKVRTTIRGKTRIVVRPGNLFATPKAAVIPKEWITEDTCYYINETGRFVMGGPSADTGLTGRKIIVDTYGGVGSHGGGCFSGKDPSKVDRSASYMARYIAKNIVGAGLAQRVEVQVAYAIGYPEPVSFMVDTLGTGTVSEEVIEKAVKKHFDLRPRAIIERLDLLRPIYRKTAAYGHFGRNDPDFTWEKLDMVDVLKDECGV